MPFLVNVAGIRLDERDIEFHYVRSSGPGGQNVNKVSTAVQLRLDIDQSPKIPDRIKDRLTALAGSRVTAAGILIITARRFRTQERNKQDVLEKLEELIKKASIKKRKRIPTGPSLRAKINRLQKKHLLGQKKKLREKPGATTE